MKKIYEAPALELLAFCSLSPIGAVIEDEWGVDPNNSQPWNDGELDNWT